MFKNLDLLKTFIKRTVIIFLIFFGIYCIVTYFLDYANANINPKIETEDYTVIGQMTQNGEYFVGIPYAEDTLFEPTRPMKLKGFINATSGGHACFKRREPKIDRFCPYLNIYRCMVEKKKAWHKLLDVLVYVGTAFKNDRLSEFYPAEIINTYACQGSIIVNINYRQRPFGYFITGNTIHGNTALYDVKAALEWVKANIRYFGGDPQKITVIGAGEGAVIASLLSRIPKTSNLINKLVLMQGSSYSPHLIHELQDGIESSRIFSAQMNCSDSTTWAPGKSPLNDAPIIACLHSKGIHGEIQLSTKIASSSLYPWPLIFDNDLLQKHLFGNAEAPVQSIPTFILNCGYPFYDGFFAKSSIIKSVLDFIGGLKNPLFNEIRNYYTRHLTNEMNAFTGQPFWRIRNNFVNRIRENVLNFGPSLIEAQAISDNGGPVYFLQIINNGKHIWGPTCMGRGLFELSPDNQRSSTVFSYEKTVADIIINFVRNENPTQTIQKFKWPQYVSANPEIVVMNKNWFYTKKIAQIETADLWLCKVRGSGNMSVPAFCSS